MCAGAMSSAKKDEYRFSSCLHVRKFVFGFFHRAKPVSSKNRGFFELALRSEIVSSAKKDEK